MERGHCICIYCPAVADSIEHPLPLAYGKFKDAPTLVDRLCTLCNNKRLGVLDEQPARSGPEAFLRRFFGVEGRSAHERVNVFERGSAGGARIDMRSYDETLGIDVSLEVENGSPRQLCQLIIVGASGQRHHLPVRRGFTPEGLRAAVDRLGATSPFSEVRLIASHDELAWIEPLIKSIWPDANFGTATLASTNYSGATIDVRLTDRYFRALAKIRFHYFLSQFPEYTGHETFFASIRQFIAEGVGDIARVNEFVGRRVPALLAEFSSPNVRPAGWRAHVACAEVRPGECRAYVQMFVSEEWPAPIYGIRLAHDSRITRHRAAGHAYIHHVERQEGFDDVAISLAVTGADFDPALEPVILA